MHESLLKVKESIPTTTARILKSFIMASYGNSDAQKSCYFLNFCKSESKKCLGFINNNYFKIRENLSHFSLLKNLNTQRFQLFF